MISPHTHHDWQIIAAAGSLVVALIVAGLSRWTPWRTPAWLLRAPVAASLAMVMVVLASLTVNGVVAACFGVPRPLVHDEFSYLLAADTFAHGRLTNPTPVGWEHFESPHLLMRPTYMSKYPPGQGLSLAVGLMIANAPIVGVWLTTAAACAALYWTLLAVVPGRWALLGGLVAAVHPQWVDWSYVYWGGGVAVLGGAMMLGGWLRLMNRAGVVAAAAVALGLAVLAISRPYEGVAVAMPLMIVLALRVAGAFDRSWALPLGIVAVVFAAAACFILYDNVRVTGRALRLPIVEYADQYDVYPKFWALPIRMVQPVYRNESMRGVHLNFESGEYAALRTPGGLVRVSIKRLGSMVNTLVGPWILLLPLTASVGQTRADHRLAWTWISLTTIAIALGFESFFLPHYAAPAAAALLVLVVVGLRALRRRWPSVAVGVIVSFFAAAVCSIATKGVDPAKTGRQDVLDRLPPGRQLIFVKYLADHSIDDEWVYNDADIAAEPAIWARALGTSSDRQLCRLYAGRQIWLLSVGRDSLAINRYEGL